MIDQVRMSFAAIREAGLPEAGLAVRRLTPDELTFVGVDTSGRSHLLLDRRPRESPPEVNVASLNLSSVDLVVNGTQRGFIDLTCAFESVAEVFDHLVVAVLERFEAAGEPASAVLATVLRQWSQFFVPRDGPPGLEKLSAVFGELLPVRDAAVNGRGRAAVEAWVGSAGQRHDLRRGELAVEVKTTRAHTARVVTIHGEDQMLAPDGGALFLHFVRLEEVPHGGESLAGLVNELFELGAPPEELYSKLLRQDLSPADLMATEDQRFAVRESLTFPVEAGFPCIVPESFTRGSRPVGVGDLTYRINLDHCLDSALSTDAYRALLARLVA